MVLRWTSCIHLTQKNMQVGNLNQLALCTKAAAEPRVNKNDPQKKVNAIHQEMDVFLGV